MGNWIGSTRDDEEFNKIAEDDPNMPGRRKRKHEVKASPRNALQDEYDKIRKQHDDLYQKYERTKETLDQTKQQLDIKNQELELKKVEVETLRTRLSTLTVASITNNNPNIANLSDSHRPTKLAEQYYQLYDNDWTDSICELEDAGIKDREAIEILRDQIIEIYKLCKNKADKQTKTVLYCISQFMLDTKLPDELKTHMYDTRKANYQMFLPELTQEMNDRLKSSRTKVFKATQTFRKKGLELCWLMCIQDPPILMDYDVTAAGIPFDKAVYKEYTSTGQYVDYIVWPALFLYRGGAILCKGAAQGKN